MTMMPSSADSTMERGGVRIATADCEVDGGLAGRLERIADELLSGWRKREVAMGIRMT